MEPLLPAPQRAAAALLLAAYPLVGLLVEAGTGIVMGALMKEETGILMGGFSWIRYGVITLSGMSVVSLLWLSGSLRPKEMLAPDPSPARRAPPARDASPAGDYRPNLADFLTGVPFGAACSLSVLWAMRGPLSASVLLMSLVVGMVTSAAVVLRYTIWAPILVSVFGAGIGLILMLFSMFMGGPGFLASWAIGSVIAASFVFPASDSIRAGGKKIRRATGREVPMWVLMTGVLLLMAGPAILFRLAEG